MNRVAINRYHKLSDVNIFDATVVNRLDVTETVPDKIDMRQTIQDTTFFLAT